MEIINLPEINASFQGGFYGGQILVDGQNHAIVWAPEKTEIVGSWMDKDIDVKLAKSNVDSMSNTIAMAAAGSQIASVALSSEINGFTDWCIPAKDVLDIGYKNSKAIFKKSLYWSSTQYSEGFAWSQDFDGDLGRGYSGKRFIRRPRLVRIISI